MENPARSQLVNVEKSQSELSHKSSCHKIVLLSVIVIIVSLVVGFTINKERLPETYLVAPNPSLFTPPCQKGMYPYVSVLDNKNKVVKIFCGKTGNPIQQAIDFAQDKKLRQVKLDPGIFFINDKTLVAVRIRPPLTAPDQVTVGIYVPSDIHLFGSSDPVKPSIVQMAESFKNYYENEIKVLMFLSGSKTDSHIPVENTVIENIELRGKTNGIYKVVEGLRTNDAINVDINNVHVHDTQMSGIVLGGFSPYEQDLNSGLARIYTLKGRPDRFSQVTGNYVHNVGGDAISVTGQFVLIKNNTIDSATTKGMSNGIGVFAATSDIIIEKNTIRNSFTGIGSDGSYPYYRPHSLDGVTVADIDASGKGNEVGFNSNILIRDNTLENNKKGIVLWRSKNMTIANNTITGNRQTGTIGINVNETSDSTIWGNQIKRLDRGITFTSNGYSLKGTVQNTIGFHVDGGKELMVGNAITEVNYGIVLENAGLENNAFKANWIANFMTACDYGKDNRVIASGNNPASCNSD